MDITRNCLVMTDYDGTLAPFVSDRDKAKPWPGVVETLEALACPVVVITGRDPEEVKKLLSIQRPIDIYGEHGSVHLSSNGERRTLISPDSKTLDTLERLTKGLPAKAVEKKTTAIAIHLRNIDKKSRDKAMEVVSLWRKALPIDRWTIDRFDGGFEAKQRGKNKGNAVSSILNKFPHRPACYLGDDKTDEDAFRSLSGRGLSILVSDREKETEADIRLHPPEEVLAFFKTLEKKLKGYRR